MDHKRKSIIALIILLVLSCMFVAVPVMAEGTGDGSGGGQNIPLGLDSSIPADGQKDVSLTEDIKLTFNKNVIYLGIREANKTCFSLVDSDGGKVPVEVIMADDQTPEGFEKRRDISLHPLQKLQPGTAYTVKISPELQAKNGTSLGHEVTVSFVTAGTASKPAPAVPTEEIAKPEEAAQRPPAADKSEVTDEASAPVASEKDPAGEEKKTEKNPAEENPQEQTDPAQTYAIAAGLVLIAGVVYLQVRRRYK